MQDTRIEECGRSGGGEGRGGEGRGGEGSTTSQVAKQYTLHLLQLLFLASPDEFEEAYKVAAGHGVHSLYGKLHWGRVPHSVRVLGKAVEDVPTR